MVHVPPTARDGEITKALLEGEGVSCVVCRDTAGLAKEIAAGAGALLLTEEVLAAAGFDLVLEALRGQPPWSDLPVVMLTRGGSDARAGADALAALRNVMLLPRPAPARSIVSAVLAALRSRDRQYEIREYIEAIRRADTRLSESQARFQAMANAIPQLAWMARSDGWIFWYNQRWYDYTGTTPDQMEGWKWTSVHDPAELPRVLVKYRAAIESGEPWEDTFPLRRRDGEYRWHLSRAQPFRDASGRVHLWFGTNTDITDERRRAEERERLLESERAARAELELAARMKDDFLATLSHELRTPLNAILGWAHMLRGKRDADSLDQGLAVIERNARVQVQLIEDLLDMSRIISGKIRLKPERLDVASFVRAAIETIQPAAAAKDIRVRTVLPPAALRVQGDADRLQQVVWNLLANAVKFTPPSGWVEVRVDGAPSQVVITVSDSGPGIEPDFLPHLFERFRQADASSTRAHGGLGLGLAIVRHLVELHGGAVSAANAGEGGGAVLTVTLPVAAPLSAEPAGNPGPAVHPDGVGGDRAAGQPLRGLRVLVVDDEPDSREMTARVLEDSGAAVVLAGSADEALRLFDRDAPPDVLVSDLAMPGTDGYTLLAQLRALGKDHGGNVPAVALTAFARPEDRTRVLRAGYLEHVTKPVQPRDLVAAVAAAASRKV